jgi:hypothetical protein
MKMIFLKKIKKGTSNKNLKNRIEPFKRLPLTLTDQNLMSLDHQPDLLSRVRRLVHPAQPLAAAHYHVVDELRARVQGRVGVCCGGGAWCAVMGDK